MDKSHKSPYDFKAKKKTSRCKKDERKRNISELVTQEKLVPNLSLRAVQSNPDITGIDQHCDTTDLKRSTSGMIFIPPHTSSLLNDSFCNHFRGGILHRIRNGFESGHSNWTGNLNNTSAEDTSWLATPVYILHSVPAITLKNIATSASNMKEAYLKDVSIATRSFPCPTCGFKFPTVQQVLQTDLDLESQSTMDMIETSLNASSTYRLPFHLHHSPHSLNFPACDQNMHTMLSKFSQTANTLFETMNGTEPNTLPPINHTVYRTDDFYPPATFFENTRTSLEPIPDETNEINEITDNYGIDDKLKKEITDRVMDCLCKCLKCNGDSVRLKRSQSQDIFTQTQPPEVQDTAVQKRSTDYESNKSSCSEKDCPFLMSPKMASSESKLDKNICCNCKNGEVLTVNYVPSDPNQAGNVSTLLTTLPNTVEMSSTESQLSNLSVANGDLKTSKSSVSHLAQLADSLEIQREMLLHGSMRSNTEKFNCKRNSSCGNTIQICGSIEEKAKSCLSCLKCLSKCATCLSSTHHVPCPRVSGMSRVSFARSCTKVGSECLARTKDSSKPPNMQLCPIINECNNCPSKSKSAMLETIHDEDMTGTKSSTCSKKQDSFHSKIKIVSCSGYLSKEYVLQNYIGRDTLPVPGSDQKLFSQGSPVKIPVTIEDLPEDEEFKPDKPLKKPEKKVFKEEKASKLFQPNAVIAVEQVSKADRFPHMPSDKKIENKKKKKPLPPRRYDKPSFSSKSSYPKVPEKPKLLPEKQHVQPFSPEKVEKIRPMRNKAAEGGWDSSNFPGCRGGALGANYMYNQCCCINCRAQSSRLAPPINTSAIFVNPYCAACSNASQKPSSEPSCMIYVKPVVPHMANQCGCYSKQLYYNQ